MAQRIKAARERRGWTQEQLAERAQVHRVYLAQIETSKRDPRVSVLLKIAKALGVRLDDLVK